MPFNVNNNTVVTDDRIVQSVSGAVGARPGTPTVGMTFFNTTDSIMEVYNGTTWISTTVGGGGGATPNAWAWGGNNYGQLGDNTNTSKSSPVSVVGGFTDWISASAGSYQTLALRANGTLYGWGSNTSGQLGNNSTVSGSSPVLVVGGITDWVSVGVGANHSAGVRANGTLYAWGSNNNCTLGDNTAITASKSSPVVVAGGITDWVSVSVGQAHSVGLRAEGTLYAWGLATYGRLGINAAGNRSSPVVVAGGIVNWVSASAGASHSLGIRANGTMMAWGYNGSGQLGDNSIVSRSSPVSVVGGILDWVGASAGGTHSLGVRANGTMMAWGYGNDGRLGIGVTGIRSSPVVVAGGIADWVVAEAGGFHSTGIRANGTLYAWGAASGGRLGDSSTADKSSPVLVSGGFTDWVGVSAGGQHNFGLRR